MNITEQFLNFTLLGAEWVLWLLIVLSIASVAVMIERGMFFAQRRVNVNALAGRARRAIQRNDANELGSAVAQSRAMAARVARAGIAARDDGIDAVSESMNSEKSRSRQDHDQNLILLGTLGNNAPFIGLFGTVLGIIKAFNDLKLNPQGGLDVVGAGVSEALVATAVGILVAIPAVVAFNVFNRRVRNAVAQTDAVAHVILQELYAAGAGASPGSSDAPASDDDPKEST